MAVSSVALCCAFAIACGKATSDESNGGGGFGGSNVAGTGSTNPFAGAGNNLGIAGLSAGTSNGGSAGFGTAVGGDSGVSGGPGGMNSGAGGAAGTNSGAGGAAGTNSGAGGAAGNPSVPATTATYWKFGGEKNDEARVIGVDASENVYVGGNTQTSLNGLPANLLDTYIRKYDAAGNVLWTQQWGDHGSSDLDAMAVDASGNAYVAGYFAAPSTAEGATAYHLVKYDASGTLLWGRPQAPARSNVIALDGTSSVYLSGALADSSGFTVQKYSADGASLWTAQFALPLIDVASGIAVDLAGNIYLSITTVEDPTTGIHDSALYRLDATGKVIWTQQIAGPLEQRISGVAVDASGNIYVAGNTDGALGGANAGGSDAFVRKFDPSGHVLWTEQFGTPVDEYLWAIQLDAHGNAYVAGPTEGPLAGAVPTSAGYVGFVRKYDPNGAVQWTQQCSVPETNTIWALALGASGSVYGAGTIYVPHEQQNAFVVKVDVH